MYPEVKDYLDRNGYSSIEEWALDSDMKKKNGVWYDSAGNQIFPQEYLAELIAEGIAE